MLVDEYEVEAWYLLPIKEYEQNPSSREGMTPEQISQSRYDACAFIARIGQHLRLYQI